MTVASNNVKTRRFAVIGAGASGLAILRVFADELKQELALGECEIICFEKRNDSGGIWLPGEPNPQLPNVPATPLYNSLTTNLPLPVMAFLSHSFAPSTWLFPPHQEVNKYLHDYEKLFDLRRFIAFDTLVSRALWDEHTNKWVLTLQRNSQLENQTVESFDHLLIGNGHYAKPYSPNFEGLDLWVAHESRSVMHSMWYREPSSYNGLRVLVIGGGPSGNDISGDISEVAKETIQSVRSFQDGQVGRITQRGAIARFTADGLVIFKSGKQAYVDRIVLATGYKYDFPFLPQLPLRNPEPNSPTLYNSGSHIYPLAQHLFPLMAPFPPTSAAFFGLPSKVAPFPLFEVQALLAARVMMGRADIDFDQEYQVTLGRNKKFFEALGAERAARVWHILDTPESQFGYREHLWRLAGEPYKAVPAWTFELYDKKFVVRDEWRDLVKRGEADSWTKSIEKGTIDEWVDLAYRVLRRAEAK